MINDKNLNLRNAPRDGDGQLAVGEGQNLTSRDSIGDKTSYRVPSFVVDIKREILQAVYDASGVALTRAQIAKAVGRKKTPWLTNQIEELVKRGYLVREHGTWKNGCLMFWYRINQ